MRMQSSLLLLCMSILCVSLVPAPPSRAAHMPNLPADLLYVTLGERGLSNQIMRVDALTLESSIFYVDPFNAVRPLSWSPDGNYLAFLRAPSALYRELCLLTREGASRIRMGI